MNKYGRSVLAAAMTTHLPGFVAEGLSNAEIGRRLGCRAQTVLTWRRRLNLPDKPEFWTPERIGLLRHYWAKGWSGTRIGMELGCSKNSVLGKAHRLGLEQRDSPINRRREAAETPCHPSLVGDPGDDNATPAQNTGDTGPTIQKAQKTCQWPIGDPRDPDFRFCGKKISKLPYCEEHKAIAWSPRK